MGDADCVALLKWALPRMQLRWAGYRNVRGQVCKRIRRRIAELALPDVEAYRNRLLADPEEWRVLRGLCGVTISRFYRDATMWDALRDEVLTALAEQASGPLRCWSVGCASGEEPYTLAIVWKLALAPRFPNRSISILATDVDERVLRRARVGEYAAGTLRELPDDYRDQAFERHDGAHRLRDDFRAPVELRCADARTALPDERFDLILCRNLLCTYFDEALQRETLARLLTCLGEGGAFVVGRGEQLPERTTLRPWRAERGIYRT